MVLHWTATELLPAACPHEGLIKTVYNEKTPYFFKHETSQSTKSANESKLFFCCLNNSEKCI